MENKLPKRKSIRIPEYDYSQNGYYFITICTQNRCKILSSIVGVGEQRHIEAVTHIRSNSHNIPDDPLYEHIENQLQNDNEYKIELTKIGIIVEEFINSINNTYKDIKIDNYVIMPNHIHMICIIERHENGSSGTPTPTNAKIPFLVSTFKRLINKKCNQSIWQRNYYEHVIRNEKEYIRILEYIQYNPLNWIYDKYY